MQLYNIYTVGVARSLYRLLAVALPQTSLGELTALHQSPQLNLWGLLLKERRGRRTGAGAKDGDKKGREKEERGRTSEHSPSSKFATTALHTYDAKCDSCSNRPHLCTACRGCDLVIKTKA